MPEMKVLKKGIGPFRLFPPLTSTYGKEDEMSDPKDMWQCQTANCGYIYDPARGDKKGKIPPGTRFEDLPDDWKCPCCGVSKQMFRPLAGPGAVAEKSVKCAD